VALLIAVADIVDRVICGDEFQSRSIGVPDSD